MKLAPLPGKRSRWLTLLGTAAALGAGVWVIYGSSRMLLLLWSTRDSIVGRALAGAWYVSVVGFCVSIFVFAIIPWPEPEPPIQPGRLKALLVGPRPSDVATARLWFRLRITLAFLAAFGLAIVFLSVADWTGLTR